jgi:integrase
LRSDAGANDPVFASRKGGHLTERAVNGMVKRTARKAGINEAVSPHWLRHAHGSHAIDRGTSLPEVQSTLGHGNIATTSGCTPGPTRRAAYTLIRECFFDEETGKGKRRRLSVPVLGRFTPIADKQAVAILTQGGSSLPG